MTDEDNNPEFFSNRIKSGDILRLISVIIARKLIPIDKTKTTFIISNLILECRPLTAATPAAINISSTTRYTFGMLVIVLRIRDDPNKFTIIAYN
jgi:hypothetical protein